MFFGRAESDSSKTEMAQQDRDSVQTPRRCPKTGRLLGHKKKRFYLLWLMPIIGFLSLLWFLIRVIPKPSRSTYPCQRMAAPFATGFVIWLTGLIGSAVAYRRAKLLMRQSRYMVALLCVAVSISAVWISLSFTTEEPATAAFVPSEPANTPMGVAKGIHPGRVVWVRDPGATSWDGSTGSWWDDSNTDQDAVDVMLSKTLQNLTGQPSDAESWDALFKHFNSVRGRGDLGYQQGEKIAIKINMNQENNSSGNWSPRVGNPSPHVIHSVVKQLIEIVGVPGSAITIYDASRYIGNPVYNKIRSDPNPEFLDVRFVVKNNLARNGRLSANYDTSNPLRTKAGTAYLPRCVTGAKYLINMALLRAHSMFGITLCAKNHFGSTYFPSGGGWTPAPLHNYGRRENAMGSYNCLVNLNGHTHLSGKTLLYMIDGLYPARNQGNDVIRWTSFGDDWFSGMLASQDPVAIDSVGLDFLRHEDALSAQITDVTGNPDNYLHEAALAENPPSGTVYDPEGDGTRLASLGVHEHWNNPIDKQYSRNLGTGDGIELVIASFATDDGPIENAATGLKYDQLRYAIGEAKSGDTIVLSEGSYPGDIDIAGGNLTVSSTDPDDPAVVAATVISGGGTGVAFSGGQDSTCVLTGFTISGAETGIYCSGSSPTIANCRIERNAGAGIELHNGSNPVIVNCEVSANAGSGVEMLVERSGRVVTYNAPAIGNCAIAANGQSGISGGKPTVVNCTIVANEGFGVSCLEATIADSIVYYNGYVGSLAQIDGTASVTYSDIEGGWSGEGNIDEAPCFAELGYWDLGSSLADASDDTWVRGDYHLRSQAGRWDPEGSHWVQDLITSPCIDAGNPAADCAAAEPMPNGGCMNMGAYGGTPQASKSLAH
jgi:parallel beta-helix repeat protein